MCGQVTFFAVPIFAVVALAVWRRRGRLTAGIIVTLLFIAVGLFLARSSAYGGIFVAAALPAGLAAGIRSDDSHRPSILTLALIGLVPIALIVVSVGPALATWAWQHGLHIL